MTSLPKYSRPPVSEVVLSVQFEALVNLTPAHLGAWWQRDEHRRRYPVCEVRSPLEPVVERFGQPGPPRFSFALSPAPSVALWFLSQDRSELLQLQADRFTRNWTRGGPEVPYPGYAALRPDFVRDWSDFLAFLSVSDEQLGEPEPTQVEVTYVNAIQSGDAWERHGQLASVFVPWSSAWGEASIGEPEDVQVVQRHVITDGEGEPVGRLIFNLQPVFDASTDRPSTAPSCDGSSAAPARRNGRHDEDDGRTARASGARLHGRDHSRDARAVGAQRVSVLTAPGAPAGLLGTGSTVDRRAVVGSSGEALTVNRYAPRSASYTLRQKRSAAWQAPFVEAVNRLARLVDDWDSYGALPLNPEAVVLAFELLERLEFDGDTPHAAPNTAGGLHLEWERAGLAVEVDVAPDGVVSVLVERDGDMDEWTTGPQGDEALRAALRQLSGARM